MRTSIAGVGVVIEPHRFNLEAAESVRAEPPAFESLEEFFAWQREEFRTGPRDRAIDVRGRQLEILIYSLPPLKLITPFGVVVLIEKPDRRSIRDELEQWSRKFVVSGVLTAQTCGFMVDELVEMFERARH